MDDPQDPLQSSSSHPYSKSHILPTAIIQYGCSELESLREVKLRGWGDEKMDSFFAEQRSVADNANDKLEHVWFESMKGVLKEIDLQSHCIPATGILKFLDLGCCPGGFSSYILAKNAGARGFGISLEPTDGGHEYLVEIWLRPRHDIHFTNLTRYQLGPSKISGRGLKVIPFDIRNRSFNLALLDGHQLRTQTSALKWDGHRLPISQLILALQGVKAGGTIIVKLSCVESHYAARILYLLDHLSESLTTCKPRSMHTLRGTFYAIAQGVGAGPNADRLPAILESLKNLWVELTFGGEGLGRYMTDDDLDFIVSIEDLIPTYLDRLVELGREVWKIQMNSLKKTFRKRGVM